MKDLFGNEIVDPAIKPKRKPQPKGFAAPPGTGPEGETCKSCLNARRSGRFWKCSLVKSTCGMGTDIRLKWDACRFWEPRAKDEFQ